MAKPTKESVAQAMKEMDLCMMTTHGAYGWLVSRPMSNNRQVEWNGDSYFFTRADTRKVRDIERDSKVALDFQGDGVWLTIRGNASLHDDADLMKEHWTDDIETWFGHGLDDGDDDILLIKVTADEAELYGRDEGIVEM